MQQEPVVNCLEAAGKILCGDTGVQSSYGDLQRSGKPAKHLKSFFSSNVFNDVDMASHRSN